MASPNMTLPDDWLIEIGRINVKWAAFEGFFSMMLQKLAGFDSILDERFTILTAHSSMPQRIHMFEALCHYRLSSYPFLANYKEVSSRLRTAQATRNKFVHNMIGMNEDGVTAHLLKISARGQLKTEFENVTLDDLRAANAQLQTVVEDMYRLVLQADPQRT